MKKIVKNPIYFLAFVVGDAIVDIDITGFPSKDSAYRYKKTNCDMKHNAIIEEQTTVRIVDIFSNPLNHKQGGD